MSSMLRSVRRRTQYNRMKKAGCVSINKHNPGIRSFFAEHWRDPVNAKGAN